MGHLRGLILLGSLALLGACADPGPEPAELTKFKPAMKLSVAWKSSIGESPRYEFSPAIWEGDYFVAGEEGELTRLDGAKGKVVWRVDTKTDLSGGVGAGDGLVLVGSRRGELLAFDPAGKARWQVQLSSEVLNAPAVARGIVVVRTGDGRITGLDAKDGSRKWEYVPTLPPLVLRVPAGVTVRDDLVFAGFPGGKMIALRLATGTLLWETAVAEPKGETELERVADVVGDPVVQDGQVCAAAYQGRIGCFDEQRGTLTWARNASSTAGLASDAGAFYYVDDAGTVHAVDRASGASLWKQEILARRSVGAPGRVGSYVIVGDFEGYLHVFDREDGHLVGRIDTDDGPITAAPVAVGEGRFIVQTREGHLYAITIR